MRGRSPAGLATWPQDKKTNHTYGDAILLYLGCNTRVDDCSTAVVKKIGKIGSNYLLLELCWIQRSTDKKGRWSTTIVPIYLGAAGSTSTTGKPF